MAFHATRLETVNHAHQWVKSEEAILRIFEMVRIRKIKK